MGFGGTLPLVLAKDDEVDVAGPGADHRDDRQTRAMSAATFVTIWLVQRRHLGRRGHVKAAEACTHAGRQIDGEADPPAPGLAPVDMHQSRNLSSLQTDPGSAWHERPPGEGHLSKRRADDRAP